VNRRLFALAAIALVAAAPVKKRPAPAPAPVPYMDYPRVALNTAMGTIVIELDAKHAPITTANFLKYVDQRRFDGIVFYRVMKLPYGTPPSGLIQAGTRYDPKRVLKPIAHEPTSQTGVLHKAGAISMARFAPGTATGDFSILLSDMPGLDADAKNPDPDAAAGYAAFGHVVSGMDVVRKIFDAPIDPAKGEGILKGQMIAAPVRIVTARRASAPPPSAPVAPQQPAS
jgi:peptidyl-prolyl cis-trans isomerase A (cyclophilin A)